MHGIKKRAGVTLKLNHALLPLSRTHETAREPRDTEADSPHNQLQGPGTACSDTEGHLQRGPSPNPYLAEVYLYGKALISQHKKDRSQWRKGCSVFCLAPYLEQ